MQIILLERVPNLGQMGDVDGAVAAAAEVTEASSRIASPIQRFRVFHEMAEVLAEIGAVDAALETAEQASDSVSWRDIATALEEVGFSDADARWSADLDYSHHRILRGIATERAGDGRSAIDLALSIEHPTVRAFALNDIAVAAATAGAVDSAVDALATLVDVTTAEAGTVASLLRAHENWLLGAPHMQANLGDAAAARTSARLLAEAVAENGHLDNRARFLAGIAHSQAAVGDPEGARTTLERAIGRAGDTDLEPSEETAFLRALAGALAALGDGDAALATIDRMDDSGRSDALAHVAIAHAEAGAIATALDLAIGIEDPAHRADALAGIGRTLGR